MDIIRIFNGLGNQMSQYAFYYAKKKRRPYLTYFITNRYESENVHNGYELGRIFGIKSNALKERIFYHILESLFKPVLGYRILGRITKQLQEKSNYDFDSSMLESPSIFGFTFYWGGWHSPKYFEEHRKELIDTFRFDENLLNESSKKWRDRINSDISSCSIHIRRGDFLNDPKWGKAITEDYYEKAIEIIRKESLDVKFYVFSNDIAWCREHWGDNGFYYIDCNNGLDSWQDMYLMSLCHHHINANSTFSWWGAWLCKHSDSITIVPNRFRADVDCKDVYPDNWIKL